MEARHVRGPRCVAQLIVAGSVAPSFLLLPCASFLSLSLSLSLSHSLILSLSLTLSLSLSLSHSWMDWGLGRGMHDDLRVRRGWGGDGTAPGIALTVISSNVTLNPPGQELWSSMRFTDERLLGYGRLHVTVTHLRPCSEHWEADFCSLSSTPIVVVSSISAFPTSQYSVCCVVSDSIKGRSLVCILYQDGGLDT